MAAGRGFRTYLGSDRIVAKYLEEECIHPMPFALLQPPSLGRFRHVVRVDSGERETEREA